MGERASWGRRAGVATVVLAGLGALVLGGCAAWTHGTASGRIVGADAVAPHEVAIVFGAEVYADGTPAPFTAARLDVALQLYRAGRAQVLVMSGNNAPEHHRETTSMRRYLEQRGVPGGRIVEDEAGNDTYDTCIRARDTFGVRRAILVSQTYHLPRAVTACRALGVDAVGVGDDTVRDRDFWPIGVAREVPANVKLALDVLRRSAPEVADPPSAAVATALSAAR